MVALLVMVGIYIAGACLAWNYDGRNHLTVSRLWTAISWPLLALLVFVAVIWVTAQSVGDIHESRHYYKRSWNRITRDYPVLGRAYWLFTLGR